MANSTRFMYQGRFSRRPELDQKQPENSLKWQVLTLAKTLRRAVSNPRAVSGHFEIGRQITQKL